MNPVDDTLAATLGQSCITGERLSAELIAPTPRITHAYLAAGHQLEQVAEHVAIVVLCLRTGETTRVDVAGLD
eukprot:scaffold1113_cov379-Prasinococcus_capsulatus_cf.AAC.2